MSEQLLDDSPLGQRSSYIDRYDNSLLFPIPRQPKREAIGIGAQLPFKGYDLWTAFELSWLNPKGKPMVAMADIVINCESTNIIESKSFKLYLNSFNNTVFDSQALVRDTLILDLSRALGLAVDVHLTGAMDYAEGGISQFDGFYLDELDVDCKEYTVNPSLLSLASGRVQDEQLYSHLLKSNCLVTGQPDWGSIQITYSGPKIDANALLQYLVSFRNHNEFHEQCVERIFMDIQRHCKPDDLTVYARYTRRGGLDINPIRSTASSPPPINARLFRQ